MKKELFMKVLVSVMLYLSINFLTGCTTQGGLPAPCDQYATFCGTKTKINQW